MQLFYFLTPDEHFDLLKEVAGNWKSPVGISFRRFATSGFDPGFVTYDWEEDLANKYLEGGYAEIYLTANHSQPEHEQDWSFTDREANELIINEGGRISGRELEKSYLRVFARKSNAAPLYRKLRTALKNTCEQGLYAGKHYYKDMFFSEAAANMTMVGKFGSHEFRREQNA